MKTTHLLILLPATAIVTVLAQGPLTPPGAPAPVMKTLDQIEPRTPVSSLPFTINLPGSYYLPGNFQFTAASGNAITIATSHVTLDLMGFTLSSTLPVTGDAIRINAGVRQVEIKNGSIVGNTAVTVSGTPENYVWTVGSAGFNTGINVLPGATGVNAHQFSHLRIAGCRTAGLSAGTQAMIENVSAIWNGNAGIEAASDSCLVSCIASTNGNDGISAPFSSVMNSAASANKLTGITSSSVSNSSVAGNGTQGINAVSVCNCSSRANGGNGISCNVAANSSSIINAGTGIAASVTANCHVNSNSGHGILSGGGNGSVANCTSFNNGGTGIFGANGSVTNSVAILNGSDGFSADNGVLSFSKAASNNASNNGSVNIDADGATRTGNNPVP